MRVGDSVVDKTGLKGRVVANIDADEFSPDDPREQWAYLGRGIMVQTIEVGLVHYENSTDLTLAQEK